MSTPDKPSILAPLGIPTFRTIWSANVVSNIGTLMQQVGAAWLMTSLTTSTLLVGLVQTASTLPILLVGLFAGALADLVDRRTLLLRAQTWMLGMATLLGMLTLFGYATPHVLLGLTFAIGLGGAINLPAWQATVQDIVPKPLVASAVSLNSIAFNVARAVGPALGGLVVAVAGPAMAFFSNAASFLATIFAISSWKPAPSEPRAGEDLFGAIRAGVRYLLHAPRLQAPILRSMAFNLCAGAVWSLLPLLARDVLKTTAVGYGLLLAAFGLGSITAALVLPRLRGQFAVDRILALGSLLAATAFLGLWQCRMVWQAGGLLFFSGAAWVGVLVNFNVAVQTSVPDWVRGRALSFYLLAFQGVLALNGALWGWLAGVIGIQMCFAVAAAGLAVGPVLIRFLPLVIDESIDLRPSTLWPDAHQHFEAPVEEGAVLITIEYRIAPEDLAKFRRLMLAIRERRLRDGAQRWRLCQDARDPVRVIELFRVDSWAEHLRQHARTTMEDRAIEESARALHRGNEPPVVTHYFSLED